MQLLRVKNEGMNIGLEKGKIEGKSQRSTEISTNVLLEGFDVYVIERETGLSEADILSFKHEIKTAN